MMLIDMFAGFLMLAALWLAYQAGAHDNETKDEAGHPPVILFSVVVGVAAYFLLVLS